MHEIFCWQRFHGLLLEDNIVFCKPLSRGFSRAVFWNQLLGELVSNEAFRQFIVCKCTPQTESTVWGGANVLESFGGATNVFVSNCNTRKMADVSKSFARGAHLAMNLLLYAYKRAG